MTDKRKLASELLPLLAATFPHTFFADPKQVRPLKINIRNFSIIPGNPLSNGPDLWY